MSIFIQSWPLFCLAFGLMLLITLIMSAQSLYFYTQDVVEKKFNIMDLEMPATTIELENLIKGLYAPGEKTKKALGALKGQLYIDFLFMPCAYGSIFLLCMLVSAKMQMPFGINVFIILAWLQLVSWLCDIIENIYLLWKIGLYPALSKIKPYPFIPKTDTEKKAAKAKHKAYLVMVIIKWGIALTATISAITAICYFWLVGRYEPQSLNYLLIIVVEVIVFLVLVKMFVKNKNKN
jgi:hypothetical protein